MKTLILLRHGRTAWNATGRFQGHADPALDAVGRRQARDAAAALARLRPFGVVTSDLRRARQTAAVVAMRCGAPVRIDPSLREVDLGAWEGLDDATAADRFPDEYWRWRQGEDIARGGGETLAEAGARVATALLAVAADCPPGESVVVVAHGLASMAAMRQLGEPPRRLENGGWATLVVPLLPCSLD